MKFLKCIISIFFTIFILTLCIIFYNGFNDEINKSDAIVVLGNKVELSGELSLRLKSRLDKAIKLYNDKISSLIIVSGGIGKEGFDEAVVMRDYLLKNNIQSDNIIVDSGGSNTMMTAINSKSIATEKNIKSVLIVSNWYHISRSILAFKKVGFTNINHAHAEYFESRDIYSILREVIGYYSYLIK